MCLYLTDCIEFGLIRMGTQSSNALHDLVPFVQFKKREKHPCSDAFSEVAQYRANIYLFKVSNRNTRKRCEICSKVIMKTLK